MRRFALAGLSVAAASTAAFLLAGGVGSAAQGPLQHRRAQTRPAAHAAAASSSYLRIAGIPGESIDAGYTNQQQLKEWSWKVINSGKPAMGDLAVSYTSDRSVPLLQADAEFGKRISQVQLTQTNGSNNKTRVIILTNAAVDSISESDNEGEAASVDVSFSYEQLEEIYYYYPSSGGSPHIYKSCYNQVSQTSCTG